jgi:hypothetical protein
MKNIAASLNVFKSRLIRLDAAPKGRNRLAGLLLLFLSPLGFGQAKAAAVLFPNRAQG